MSLVFARNTFFGEPLEKDRLPYRPKVADNTIDPHCFALGVSADSDLNREELNPFLDSLDSSGFSVHDPNPDIRYDDEYWRKATPESGLYVPVNTLAKLCVKTCSTSSRNDVFAVISSVAGLHNVTLHDINQTDTRR